MRLVLGPSKALQVHLRRRKHPAGDRRLKTIRLAHVVQQTYSSGKDSGVCFVIEPVWLDNRLLRRICIDVSFCFVRYLYVLTYQMTEREYSREKRDSVFQRLR
jgi:hypothetical protein